MYKAPFLQRRQANHVALSPLPFIERTAAVFPDRTSVVHRDGGVTYTWAQTRDRCVRLASALAGHGVTTGDSVAVLAPNIPATLESHFGVPMSGAVLSTLNTRLDAKTIKFMLEHMEARVLIVDRSFKEIVEAIRSSLQLPKPLLVVTIMDGMQGPLGFGDIEYENFLARGDPAYAWKLPADEFDAISLNYTSGTTSDPKGVVYAHRACFLQAVDSVQMWNMQNHPVFLWTSPMFHCNGWHFPWTVTALAGTHVCMRDVVPAKIYAAIDELGVTHMGGAPTVLVMLVNAPAEAKRPLKRPVQLLTAGAPPPAAVLQDTEKLGFVVTQMYGLTETHGQVTYSQWKSEWDALPKSEQARLKARQGVMVPLLGGLVDVVDAETLKQKRRDGKDMGELVVAGNLVMKGYLKNPAATEKAFKGGVFWSGDIAVKDEDGFIQIKDRSKDVIISGGENISTVEVEGVLFEHPDVMEAAVVAAPDEKWGETPFAFVTLKAASAHKAGPALAKEIIEFAKNNMARFKAPRTVVFSELPRNGAGKIQKFVLRDRARQLTGNGAKL